MVNFSPMYFYYTPYLLFIHMSTTDIKNRIKLILELFISCLIALEVSLNPNPYIEELIFLLLIYTALKYNLPNKTLSSIRKYL